MNSKTIIRTVLLAVIAIALGSRAMKEFGPAKAIATSGENPVATAASTAVATRSDGVTVINFHDAQRCRTCIGIGKLAKQTLDDKFASEEKSGMIRWQHINHDEPANAHFVKDYQLVSSTILVTLWKDGKEVKWNRLDSVWDHIGDAPVFRACVAQGVRDLLNQS